MKIERLTDYATARQVMEVRLRRGDQGEEAVRLLPIALIPADTERDKPAHVLALSWTDGRTPRFEHLGDGDVLPLRVGEGYEEIEEQATMAPPWWTNEAEQLVHRIDAGEGVGNLLITRNVITELALLEALAAASLLEIRVRFQYARGDQSEWRDATIVGLGGKGGHLVYGLDHDRLKDGKPQLRSYKHGSVRGLMLPFDEVPVWDGGRWQRRGG
jgi:hypothetical protein